MVNKPAIGNVHSPSFMRNVKSCLEYMMGRINNPVQILKALSSFEDDKSWNDATYKNSWVDYHSTYYGAQYRKINGIVYIRGSIKDGTAGQPVFTLPEGYRPHKREVFANYSTGPTIGYIDIDTNGDVDTSSNINNGYSSLSGINFFAAETEGSILPYRLDIGQLRQKINALIEQVGDV